MSSENKVTVHTYVDREHCDFTWVISDYALAYENVPGQIISPVFSVGHDDRRQFRLELREITAGVDNNERYVLLFLVCRKAIDVLSLKYKVSIIKDDTVVYTRKDSDRFTNHLWQIFIIPRKDMNQFVSSTDTVIIRCELTLSTGVRRDFAYDEPVDTHPMSVPKLEFDWAFFNEKFIDVVLRTASGKEIPAHRLMLAAASPVFKAMFSHDMLEDQSHLIDMIDVSYDTAFGMLKYIYTGKIENEKLFSIIELLVAADKYEIEDLKKKCEIILSSRLSSANVVDVLKVADKCSMKKLKKNAVDFVKMHMNRSLDTEDVAGVILNMERLFSN